MNFFQIWLKSGIAHWPILFYIYNFNNLVCWVSEYLQLKGIPTFASLEFLVELQLNKCAVLWYLAKTKFQDSDHHKLHHHHDLLHVKCFPIHGHIRKVLCRTKFSNSYLRIWIHRKSVCLLVFEKRLLCLWRM